MANRNILGKRSALDVRMEAKGQDYGEYRW